MHNGWQFVLPGEMSDTANRRPYHGGGVLFNGEGETGGLPGSAIPPGWLEMF